MSTFHHRKWGWHSCIVCSHHPLIIHVLHPQYTTHHPLIIHSIHPSSTPAIHHLYHSHAIYPPSTSAIYHSLIIHAHHLPLTQATHHPPTIHSPSNIHFIHPPSTHHPHIIHIHHLPSTSSTDHPLQLLSSTDNSCHSSSIHSSIIHFCNSPYTNNLHHLSTVHSIHPPSMSTTYNQCSPSTINCSHLSITDTSSYTIHLPSTPFHPPSMLTVTLH